MTAEGLNWTDAASPVPAVGGVHGNVGASLLRENRRVGCLRPQ